MNFAECGPPYVAQKEEAVSSDGLVTILVNLLVSALGLAQELLIKSWWVGKPRGVQNSARLPKAKIVQSLGWLGDLDSNQDSRSQSPMFYR
jgi:hypothetical protein